MGIIAPILSLAGGLMSAAGQSAGAKHQAQQATYAAQAARANANAADAYYRDDLRTTLANISAIRASLGMEQSPTADAIAAENRRVSDDQRISKVAGIRAQAMQASEDAKFYRRAAGQYMAAGILGSLGNFAGNMYDMYKSSWGG